MPWLILWGVAALWYLSRSKSYTKAAEGDKKLTDNALIDGEVRLVYKPEVRAGLLNALLTKAIIIPTTGADSHTLVMQEMGVLQPASRSAYLAAMMAQAAGQEVWVTPTLTTGDKSARFLYWGNKPPSTATSLARIIDRNSAWPGHPPITAIPVSDDPADGFYPIVPISA